MPTNDRYPYLTSTVLDQDFLDDCAGNLTNQLEMIAEIETPTGTVHASDRNKYVGSTFYEALMQFPTISRTVGDWLSSEVEFSTINIALANVDGRYNDILPSGANYQSFIGKTIEIKLGLRDVESTYKTIFSGFVTSTQGFGRTTKTIQLTARDKFDNLNVEFPPAAFTSTTFPNIADDVKGLIVPVIYGDWTISTNTAGPSVPAYVVNGADANVIGGTRNNIELVISDNDNTFFDTTQVYLLRGSRYWPLAAADITNVSNNRAFEIIQNGASTVDGVSFVLENGDKFFVRVRGKDLGAYDDNLVAIAKDMLVTYGGLIDPTDFDANWDTYRDKNTPAQSNIAGFKCRVWIQENQKVMQYVLSLLEQVRLEAFIDRNLKLKISSLQFEDFEANPSFTVHNPDVVLNSFRPKLDARNNFNRAKGRFNYLPDLNDNYYNTSLYRNNAAITQAGIEIGKLLVFPNLYEPSTVIYQVQEMIKLGSAYFETIELELTWRAMLLDIGDFVKITITIGSTIFNDVPCLIREIGYDPMGLKIPVKVFSMQLVPFDGYSPPGSGIEGGATGIITEET